MDPDSLQNFTRLFSTPRLDTYVRHIGPVFPHRSRRLYLWNVELSTAVWGPLALIEVATRNAIHDAMRVGRREDWWNDPTVVLLDRHRQLIDRSYRSFAGKGNRDPTPNDIVADLNFGFWVRLLDVGIARDRELDYDTRLWRPRLIHAFPGRTSDRRRGVHRVYNEVRLLRNRVAHHEPIFQRNPRHTVHSLIEAAALVDADLASFIRLNERYTAAARRKQEAVSQGIVR
ncbi:hypothetical protein D9V32_05640 [Mycetocola tolaasinivorans]|uniref:CAAX protease n=1 Tax=Mycetocola tolaasinivorans TaxID=76635 RepID=A0A3L7A7T5_9MICO|nr:Abi family protein [Mycetocola tolaasinivorans]RLP76353.1 hypothetical protein D9V32_05640 [Mycetocola tolaasinivorans]